MSVETISRVLNLVDDRLTPVQRLVLVGIANHDGDGGAWPSKATLSRYAGVGERAVRQAVRALESFGYVTTVINGGGTKWTPNDRRPNLYALNLSPHYDGTPGTPDDGGAREAPPSESERGCAERPNGGARGDRTGVRAAPPEPSYEPPIEPSSPGNAETASAGRLKSESVVCPKGKQAGGCGAKVGEPCHDRPGPGAQPQRYGGRSHTIRVAVVLANDWWEAVTARTGHPPSGVTLPGIRFLMRNALNGGWRRTAVAGAVEELHREGRPLTGQSIEARLRGKFPGQRLSIVSQAKRSMAEEAPPLPVFGSNPIFDPDPHLHPNLRGPRHAELGR